ncbi:MAG: hypothetical protein ABI895_09215 [Deltaproteobacteria bacterium]
MQAALWCQRVENLVVGAPCGVMDQMTSSCGRAGQLLPLVCQPAELEPCFPIPAGLALWGIDSGLQHQVQGADYAEVHVAALAWSERQPSGSFHELFNVGTGQGVSVLEAIVAFETVSGVALRYRFGPRRPGDAAKVYASVDKAEREFGWRARLGIVEAMRDAWNWQQMLRGGL